MINYVKGDLFTSGAEIIAHGVNCVGGFGSGVAGQMVKRHPTVRDFYILKHESTGWKLGDIQFVPLYDNRIVANCATQHNFMPRGQCHADYEAIKTCMYKLKEYAMGNDLSIAMPKIGAGLAGGDWNVIESILKDVFTDYNVAVYYLE